MTDLLNVETTRTQFVSISQDSLDVWQTLRKIKKYNKTDSQMMRKFIQEKNTRCYFEAVYGLIQLNLTEEIKKLECPVLLIYGKNDTACPKEIGYEICSIISES